MLHYCTVGSSTVKSNARHFQSATVPQGYHPFPGVPSLHLQPQCGVICGNSRPPRSWVRHEFSLCLLLTLGHLHGATTHDDAGPDPQSYSTTSPTRRLPPVSITALGVLLTIIHFFSRVLMTNTKCDYADSERHFLSAVQQWFEFKVRVL